MVAVITGDIINSRRGDAEEWMGNLKHVLGQYGQRPGEWDIFRGDSFQIILRPEIALLAAVHIKACIKKSNATDVRMAIGVGEITHQTSKITESNGPAFVLAGECLESLKKQTLALRTNNQETDKPINIMLNLALLTANSWSKTVAKVIIAKLEHPQKHQSEIAGLLGKSQSSISEALKRGGFYEIMTMNDYYRDKMTRL
ncbi:MAG: SatD family protein [Marinilabilia sp.]